MLSQFPQLIVIDEYPNPKPFINPICKDTYDALPKIYGKKGKRKYLYNIQEIIKHEHTTFQRDCCHMEIQHKIRSPTDVEQRRKLHLSAHTEIAEPKSDHCKKRNCQCNKSKEKLLNGNRQQTTQMHAKLQKIILPHLKEIDEINQSQSHHKVLQVKNNPTFNDSREMQSRLKLIESRFQRLKQLKQSRLSKSEYIQTQFQHFTQEATEVLPPTIRKQILESSQQPHLLYQSTNKKQRYQSEPNQQSKPYYEYLQNDQRIKQKSDQTQNSFHFNRNIRRTYTTEDENMSISSITIKNQPSVSTIFHQFKKKQSSRNSKEYSIKSQNINTHNKSYSVLSNGLFKIPQAEEYENYLSNYTPMNPEFNLKGLIKKQDFHIVPADTYVYFGQIADQKKHGDGIIVTQKQIYEGKYENNLKVRGYEKNRDGIYSGQFLKGKRHGNGKFIWNNGQEFEGQWKNGKKNGFGTWKSPKGDYYQGQWKENRQHGKGYYVHFKSSKYRGYFKDFLKNGKGQEDFANGDKYIGSYEQGKPHGYGKYIWSNGDVYEGQFIDGTREGKGILRSSNGQVYDGEFKNDMKHGPGIEKYKSGQQFDGQFKDGQRFKGKLKTKNGAEITITAE